MVGSQQKKTLGIYVVTSINKSKEKARLKVMTVAHLDSKFAVLQNINVLKMIPNYALSLNHYRVHVSTPKFLTTDKRTTFPSIPRLPKRCVLKVGVSLNSVRTSHLLRASVQLAPLLSSSSIQ
jgi:hypothetical protein